MNIEKATKHYEEGMSLLRNGKFSEAERALKKALKINPDYADAYNDLGNVYLKTGRFRESFNAYRKALRYAPDHPMLLSNIGNALMAQCDYEKALGWLNKAIAQDPDNATTHSNLGGALRGLGENSKAVEAYRRAIELNPGQPMFFYNLGEILVDQGQLQEAVDCFKQALDLNPEDAKLHNGLGKAWNATGDLEQAVSCYRKAISIDPGNAESYSGLGAAYGDHGEIDEAIAALREAISLNPRLVSAYPVLARTRTFTEFDADMRNMDSLLSTRELTDVQKSQLSFSLGKAYEDLADYDRSMGLVIDAARLKRKRFDYSISESRSLFERIKTVFSADFFSQLSPDEDADRTPIFIIGMPRSGTSLVEQILASHPAVFGAGELDDLAAVFLSQAGDQQDAFPESINEFSADDLANMGRQYIDRIRSHSTDAVHITDKLPHNFLRVGLIRAVLPGARIIHCRRDPMDNCLSLFKTDFQSGHPYSYDMNELGQYYRLYRELMDHWNTTLPGLIYDLSYEDLVQDQQHQIRQLLEFCDLPWDDACLDFHHTRRKIKTASNAQVVRPIYTDSVNLWRRYENQLQPLITSLHG